MWQWQCGGVWRLAGVPGSIEGSVSAILWEEWGEGCEEEEVEEGRGGRG